jgi:hypothetical protein
MIYTELTVYAIPVGGGKYMIGVHLMSILFSISEGEEFVQIIISNVPIIN